MILQRAFRHPRRNEDLIYVNWEPGYQNVSVRYNENELIKGLTRKELIKGVTFFHEELGNVRVILHTYPFDLHVYVDELHSPDNSNHPTKTIESIGFNFIFPLILNGIIYLSVADLADKEGSYFYTTLKTIYGISFLIYCASIALIMWKKIIGYYIGAILFYLQFALFFYTLNNHIRWDEEYLYILMAIMIIQAIVLPFGMRHVIRFKEHEVSEPAESEDLLDNSL
jgi:hypothetical protein